MMDPALWASVPFNNRTALLDLAGTLEVWFRAVNRAIAPVANRSVRSLPIGTPGGATWLEAIQAQFNEAHDALGIEPPPDLASYDLADPVDWASWTWLLSQTAQTLRVAAGVR